MMYGMITFFPIPLFIKVIWMSSVVFIDYLRFYFEFLYVGMCISLAAPGKHFVMLH